MKKEEAVESVERAGHTINELYSRAWSTALYPTQYGWGASIAWAAAIPVLSIASLGHVVGAAVVQQIPPSVFDSSSMDDKPKGP
jgi:hypothetical protein